MVKHIITGEPDAVMKELARVNVVVEHGVCMLMRWYRVIITESLDPNDVLGFMSSHNDRFLRSLGLIAL